MICLPFVPRTRTNYQATPDVLKATFYFLFTQYVQNKTTIHLASTTTYKIYNIHKLHRHGPATTLANTAHGQHQSAVHIGLLFCKWKWVSANIFDNESNCSIQYNSHIYNKRSIYHGTYYRIIYGRVILTVFSIIVLSAPAVSQTSNIITIICGIWRNSDVIFLKITSPCHLTVWLNVIAILFVII